MSMQLTALVFAAVFGFLGFKLGQRYERKGGMFF